MTLVGTGSELSVALAAADLLAADGIRARVVSMPSWELFAAQDEAYRDAVLPPGAAVGLGRGRGHARAGSAGSTARSRSTASARRPPVRRSSTARDHAGGARELVAAVGA